MSFKRNEPVTKVVKVAGPRDLDLESTIEALTQMNIKIKDIRKAAAEINCSVCSKKDIKWTRYVCLLCFNYNLCFQCYNEKSCSMWHRPYHPMQWVLSQKKNFKFRNSVVGKDFVVSCPFCGNFSLTIADFIWHCRVKHEGENFTTRCPVCVSFCKPEVRLPQSLYRNHLEVHKEPSKVFNCSTCNKSAFEGNRYTCLLCPEYNQCDECYKAKRQNFQHVSYHPMQETLPKAIYSTGTTSTTNIFRCPFCGDGGFSANALTNHCHKLHIDMGQRSLLSTVYCPICTVCQISNNQTLERYSLLKEPLLDHLKTFHGLLPGEEDPLPVSVQCAICFLDLDAAVTTKKYFRCSHNSYHDRCIRTWMVTVPTCPMCRAHRVG